VAAYKPVVTGLDEPTGVWPRDHELLAAAAGSGQAPDQVSPLLFGPAVSPHYAAEMAGEEIGFPALVSAGRMAGQGADVLIVEGVGGLLVPFSSEHCVRDLAVALGMPLLIAARPGLGTINHTLLTLEAARSAGLEMAAVVMTPWPAEPEPIQLSNRLTIARLGGVEVVGLPPVTPDVEALAAAGARLPLDDWL
jgi:dethiobiotin synthetase